jgi:hypothetical protein
MYCGGVAWPPLERRLTWAIVVSVPRICVFSWLLGSIQRHRLVREAVNGRETKAGWPRSRQEFACVFFLGFVCLYHRPPPLSTYADLPTVLTIVHFDGTHPIPPQYPEVFQTYFDQIQSYIEEHLTVRYLVRGTGHSIATHLRLEQSRRADLSDC